MIIPKKVLDMKKWEIYNIFNREKNLLAGSTTKNDKFDYNYSLAIHTGEKVEKIELNRKKFLSQSLVLKAFNLKSIKRTESLSSILIL